MDEPGTQRDPAYHPCMTDGDDDAGDRSIVLPQPRRSARPVRLVGPGIAGLPGARNRSATAVLDVVAPPWLRVPSGAGDGPARPAAHRPPARPVVLRVVADDPTPAVAAAPPVPRPAAIPLPPPAPHPARARPPVAPEPGILGLSRLTRGRVGSRLFTLFFVAVYAVILVQMFITILYG